jgi:hypothetical protein
VLLFFAIVLLSFLHNCASRWRRRLCPLCRIVLYSRALHDDTRKVT